MEDFGSYLKSERELRGVTLEEIEAKTKIHVRYLHALEKNRFDELPGEVFIKGYIRSIAIVMGTNESDLTTAYEDMIKNLSAADTSNQNLPVNKKSKLDKNFIFILGLTIIFLAGVAWGTGILIYKFQKVSGESSSMLLKPKQEETEAVPEKNLPGLGSTTEGEPNSLTETDIFPKTLSEVVKDEDSAKKLKINTKIISDISNNENEEGVPTSLPENDLPLKLTIKVTDNVWFNITVDDSRVEDFILARGAEKVFYGKDHYVLNVGDRNAVDLHLNDMALRLPEGAKDNMIRNFVISSKLIE